MKNRKRLNKKILIILLTSSLFSLSAIAKPEAVQTCNAMVNIPKNGVKTDLTLGKLKHRYLDVDINGVAMRAMLDTGGMGIGGLISENFLSKINIDNNSAKTSTTHGAHGKSESKTFTMNKTQINQASVDNLMFMTTKDLIMKDDNAPVLIGSRFLCQFLVEFDFFKNTLGLYDRKTDIKQLVNSDKEWIKIPFVNFYNTGGIIFPIELNGKRVSAALDTGSPFTGINWKAAALTGINKESSELYRYKSLPHSLGASESTIVHESEFGLSVQSGKLHRADSEVRINDIHAFTQLFGDNAGVILGLPFFEKRRLLIDYANNYLYIIENQHD